MRNRMASKGRAVTLQDVAEKAGVGLSTASYVLNNKPKSVGDETRERIWQAARELGYRPNMAARSLVTRQTRIVALRISNVATAFSARVIAEIQKQAREHGYEVMISDTEIAGETNGNGTEPNTTTLQTPLWSVDGVIAFFDASSRGAPLGVQDSLTVPTVSMGTFALQGTDFVGLSLFAASYKAMQWILGSGRHRVGFLVPSAADFEGDERHEAYVRAIREHGRHPIFIYAKQNTRAAAYEAMRDYLGQNEPLEALFCYNDYAGIGAGRALREAGLNIPSQILLVGCDGIEDSDYLEWPLHTIELPIPEMCNYAWQLLLRRLENPSLPIQEEKFYGRLKIRG